MIKFLLLLLTFVVIAFCNDSSSPEFNNLFVNSLEVDFVDEPIGELTRKRRETSSETSLIKKECSCINTKFGFMRQDSSLECYQEILKRIGKINFDPFDCDQMSKLKEQTVCLNECIGRKFNFTDTEGKLVRDGLISFYGKRVMENEENEAHDAIVDKCLSVVKQKRDNGELPNTLHGCSPCTLEFTYCVFRENANRCLAARRDDTPKCKKWYKSLANGDRSSIHNAVLKSFRKAAEKKNLKKGTSLS